VQVGVSPADQAYQPLERVKVGGYGPLRW